jgi:hypothetical protein
LLESNKTSYFWQDTAHKRFHGGKVDFLATAHIFSQMKRFRGYRLTVEKMSQDVWRALAKRTNQGKKGKLVYVWISGLMGKNIFGSYKRKTNSFETWKLEKSQQYFQSFSSISMKTRRNKACTRRWGFWRDSKPFSTPQHFPSRTAFRRPPQRG